MGISQDRIIDLLNVIKEQKNIMRDLRARAAYALQTGETEKFCDALIDENLFNISRESDFLYMREVQHFEKWETINIRQRALRESIKDGRTPLRKSRGRPKSIRGAGGPTGPTLSVVPPVAPVAQAVPIGRTAGGATILAAPAQTPRVETDPTAIRAKRARGETLDQAELDILADAAERALLELDNAGTFDLGETETGPQAIATFEPVKKV